MKTLSQVIATPEQLPLISQNRTGIEVIYGAAGSGKTSTALLRLRSLYYMFIAKRERQNINKPIKILVLTYNRTLSGYIRTLTESQVNINANLELEIFTFAKWALSKLPPLTLKPKLAEAKLNELVQNFGALTKEYILKEVSYLLGRFESENLESYITAERTGRGILPRVDRHLRRKILDEIVYPYNNWLIENDYKDWNSLASSMIKEIIPLNYDIVVVDESQDFSANQLRAIRYHLAEDHTITFVMDTAQRIYARGFTWSEAGYDVRPERITRLVTNYRNTVEIATFASGILQGINIENDGALPNLTTASGHGEMPLILRGKYSKQISWAIRYIKQNINLSNESVVFLKPLAGNWFQILQNALEINDLEYVDITRENIWPTGTENIALSTFHSAKGLEFDYVFILGFNQQNTPFTTEEMDDQVVVLRKLLAVGVARARKAVFIGYKPGEQSKLVEYFVPGSYILEDI